MPSSTVPSSALLDNKQPMKTKRHTLHHTESSYSSDDNKPLKRKRRALHPTESSHSSDDEQLVEKVIIDLCTSDDDHPRQAPQLPQQSVSHPIVRQISATQSHRLASLPLLKRRIQPIMQLDTAFGGPYKSIINDEAGQFIQ